MNNATLIHDSERLFVRSCLETAPEGHQAGRLNLGASGTRHGSVRLHLLKQKLLHAAMANTTDPRVHKQLCGAANTASDLVWNTANPVLLFPCLFEEMAQDIFDRAAEAQWAAAPRDADAFAPRLAIA